MYKKKIVRQFSLQCETPKLQQRRRSLKKQLSEDLADVEPEINIRISVSAKNRTKVVDRPSPIKIAWADNGQNPQFEDGAFAKTCAEINRPNTTSKISQQSSLDRNAVLYSQTELAEKLQQAWKEREKNDVQLSDKPNTEFKFENNKMPTPKIILPLKPELVNENSLKSVFQQHIRKAMKHKSLFSESSYSPTRTNRNSTERPTTIVIPVLDTQPLPKSKNEGGRKILSRQNTIEKDVKSPKSEEEKPKTEAAPSRPSTAVSRREMFQKRTNSAFHGSVKRENNFRPPLVRAASVPTKPEPPKSKFIATKRRVKTAKAKIKTEIGSEDESDISGRRRCVQRCVSVTGGEVVTMVSLISPSGSDNEEELREEKDKLDSRANSPIKTNVIKPDDRKEEPKNFSLRKTVKSVSFQQSSIHAVRSFSASFPARRCSVATTLMIGSSVGKNDKNGQKIQEKRAQVNVLEDEERVPKRRLVRTKSAPLQRSIEKDDSSCGSTESELNSTGSIPSNEMTMTIGAKTGVRVVEDDDDDDDDDEAATADETVDNEHKFENPKEKQCWDMYCKMSEKGVAISFDTILRGMLTPTEYRLRSKPSLVPEDNCEITEN